MSAMNETPNNLTSRRDFIKNTGKLAAASALAGVAIPRVHAAENNTIQVALVGCGGRGTGAAANALSTRSGPIKLIAMADVFADRLNGRLKTPQGEKEASKHLIVLDERRSIGFDAYKEAM